MDGGSHRKVLKNDLGTLETKQESNLMFPCGIIPLMSVQLEKQHCACASRTGEWPVWGGCHAASTASRSETPRTTPTQCELGHTGALYSLNTLCEQNCSLLISLSLHR